MSLKAFATALIPLTVAGHAMATPYPAGCALSGKSLIYTYDGGTTYKVEYRSNDFTWTGLSGPDAGKSETDAYECTKVAPDIFFVRWSETSGTRVNQVVNLSENRVFSSGIEPHETWFLSGKITAP